MNEYTVIGVIALAGLVIVSPTLAGTPHLEFSTYFGGSGIEEALAITSDEEGNTYVVGTTLSSNFPTLSPYQSSCADTDPRGDVFVVKFTYPERSIAFSTYLGGSNWDMGRGITRDGSMDIYVTGRTNSWDFPTANPYQASSQNPKGFISKISSDGARIIYSTYMGGTVEDDLYAIAVNQYGEASIAGKTLSTDFPIANPYQATFGGSVDACVATLSSDGQTLLYSTYLGDTEAEEAKTVSLDNVGRILVAGWTASSETFPIVNAYQSHGRGLVDGFVSEFSSGGSALIFSTYLGGEEYDAVESCGLTRGGNAVVTGWTCSWYFPTRNPYQASLASPSSSDAFITCLSSTGSSLAYSTYLGGEGNWQFAGSRARGLALDDDGTVYVAGDTSATDFPTKDPFQSGFSGSPSLDNCDGFITHLSSTGSALIFSSYFGGTGDECLYSIALSDPCRLCLAGYTSSDDLPLAAPYQSSRQGDKDALVAEFSNICAAPTPCPTPYYVIESGDYNGNGVSDVAIFRPSSGLWAVKGMGRTYWGGMGAVPASGDYNGDGTTEVAVYRPATGEWSIRSVTRVFFGIAGDISVPFDNNGDGSTDIAIFRPDWGFWSVRGQTMAFFGQAGDLPIPGAWYDGLNIMGIFRPSNGLWALRSLTSFYRGAAGDVPVPLDYDHDGVMDWAIFRPSNGMWRGEMSAQGEWQAHFGQNGDVPVPGWYAGPWWEEGWPAIFRPTGAISGGLWALRNLTRCYFGQEGDYPASR